jgi:hypothetical protein
MTEKKPVIVFGLIALMNLLIIGFCLFFMTSSGVQAQDDKDETIPDDTVVFDVYPHPFSRGALAYSLADRWNRTDLTYYFHNCPRTIDCGEGQQAVRAGFQAWADLSPLTFTEVNSPRQADIELMWTTDTPELGSIGGVLAFAYFPSDGGDVFFDDNEPWSAFDGSEFDLYLVAAHEIGHALGLNHSSDPDALMYPVLTRRTFGLAPDDSAAIQALYGANEGVEPDSQPIPNQPSEDVEEATGEITDDVPYEYWEFDAFAGETVTVTMTTTSGDLVPYIGILTGDEEEVLAENGSSNGVSAQVSYTFDQDGTYVIVATREGVEEGFTAGTYELRLDFSEGTTDAPNVPDDADVVLATVRSYSSVDLCELYISPSTEDEWGDNQIDGILTYGNYIDFEVTPGLYDVLAVGCDGNEVEQYEIDIQQDLEIEIYEDGINIYVYGE